MAMDTPYVFFSRVSSLPVEAMWDHGCDFGSNLSAQNISWGDFSMLSWSCF